MLQTTTLALNSKPTEIFHVPWISYYKQQQTINSLSSPSLWHQDFCPSFCRSFFPKKGRPKYMQKLFGAFDNYYCSDLNLLWLLCTFSDVELPLALFCAVGFWVLTPLCEAWTQATVETKALQKIGSEARIWILHSSVPQGLTDKCSLKKKKHTNKIQVFIYISFHINFFHIIHIIFEWR